MSAPEETFTERTFVYTGQRESAEIGKAVITLRLINADGTLGEQRAFQLKRGREKTLGFTYSTQFSETRVRGLESAKWVGQWENQEDRIAWDAEERAAKIRVRRIKMEKDAGRVSEIEGVLLPLRKTWAAMSKRGDISGRRALEDAVLSALRTAPRSFEGDEE